MVRPAVGALLFKTTVPVVLAPPIRLVLLSEKLLIEGRVRVRVELSEFGPCLAVIVMGV